jgi:anti-sigma regulatory factor (Ser/Thr protein kinase)
MHYLTESESVFVLHNELALIQVLVNHLLQMLRCMPLGDETERLRVGIAVEEALRNAYYHGNLEVGRAVGAVNHKAYHELARQRNLELPYRDRRIYVRARVSRSEAVFVIRDDGPGFDPTQLPPAVDVGESARLPGRGLNLMRSIMDEVTFNAAGNEVSLRKRAVNEPSPVSSETDP